jgi:hypothetical protein
MPLRSPLVVTALVLILAELGVRVAASSLPDPTTWPSAEAQHKIDQLAGWRRAHPRADVLVTGASMADAGIDAAALAPGGAGYNAALSGAVLPSIVVWTTRVIVPRLHPATIVVGLSPVELNADLPALAADTARFAAADPIERAVGQESWLQRLTRWASAASYLVRYRTALRTPSNWGKGKERNGNATEDLDPPLTPNGQSEFFASATVAGFGALFPTAAARRDSIADGVFGGFRIGQTQVDQIRDLVEQLQAEGSRVVVVDLPIDPEAVADLPGGEASVQNVAETLAGIASATGSRFYQAGVWDPTYFADPIHLNAAGSLRLTGALYPLVAAA